MPSIQNTIKYSPRVDVCRSGSRCDAIASLARQTAYVCQHTKYNKTNAESILEKRAARETVLFLWVKHKGRDGRSATKQLTNYKYQKSTK